MKIILKEDVTNLGYKDDVVEVKNGYARNYLIPKGKAIMASPSALKVLAENLRQRAHKIAKIKADAEAVAETLKGIELTIATKTGSNGTIYGSVGSIQIAEELAKLGHEVDRKIIKVANVKELGHYTATVQLHKEVAVEIPFKVISENAPKQEEAPATEEAPAVVEEAPVAEEAPAAE
ncbi:MAG: 50S ribosomal protein L9 [Muribaculaceae bacterium]|nr:50S ribosomal protein L9 [Muribaculaceae bacterium]MBQ3910103.1 50S ribosomal protein L9 [Muribaculaceae bacterium]